jgi:HEAT repeat protein
VWRSAVTQIKPCLRHADSRVRLEAVRAIGLLGGPAFSVQLRGMAQDPAPEVREAVAEAIGKLG